MSAPLIREVVGWGRWRLLSGGALVVAGGILDGLGLLMLIPLIELAGTSGGRAQDVLAGLGIVTPGGRLSVLIAAFGAIVIARFVVVRWRDLTMLALREGFLIHLRGRLFGLIAAAGWEKVSTLDRTRAGHALTGSVERAGVAAGLLIDAGVAGLMLAVQLAFAFYMSPALALIAAVSGAGVFAALGPLRARSRERGEALTSEDLGVFDATTRFLAGLKPATAHGLVPSYVAAHAMASRRLAHIRQAFGADHSLARLLLQTAVAVIALMLIVVGFFVLDLPTGELVVLLAIFSRLSGPLMQIQSVIQHVRHGGAAYASVTALLEPLAGVGAPAPPTGPPLSAAPTLRFEAVTRRGAGGEVLLNAVTAAIPGGRVTALAGPSGAGKTTFCDLAAGLIEPDDGRILLDGAPLDPARLAPVLAYVGQEPFTIDDTLRANLLWGAPGASDAEISAALAAVGADALVAALADGLDTRLMTQGPRFSGGERQRLRLARALLRRPRMVILDEATNALDPASEAAVLEGFLGALGGATVLMVSHREEARHFADAVILLEGGRLVSAQD